jgi:hypothetical protein
MSLLLRGQQERAFELSCRWAERAVSRKLDGELPGAEWKPLRAHLHSCPECFRVVRLHLYTRAVLRTNGLVPLPAGLRISGPCLLAQAAVGAER